MSLEISYKLVAHTSILARCSMSDSTPPRDVARLKTLHLAANAMAAARPPCAPLIVSHALSYERFTKTKSSCVCASPTWRSWESCPHVYVYVCMCLHTWMSHEISYESVMHFKLSCVCAPPTWCSWESCPRVYEYVCMWLQHTNETRTLIWNITNSKSSCACVHDAHESWRSWLVYMRDVAVWYVVYTHNIWMSHGWFMLRMRGTYENLSWLSHMCNNNFTLCAFLSLSVYGMCVSVHLTLSLSISPLLSLPFSLWYSFSASVSFYRNAKSST